MSDLALRTGEAADLPPPYPTFNEAFTVWLKIGLLSFGGPAGQIALMHKVLVEEKRWISEARFLHALNYCMLLPGPEAQQLATYVGWLLHGVRGGIVAGTLFILPGFCVILTLSTLYTLFQGTPVLDSLFFGLKAAVLAVVVEAVLRVGRRALKNNVMIGLAIVAFIAIFMFHVPFPLIILAAGLFGYAGTRIRPAIFEAGGHGGKAAPERVTLDLREPEVAPGFGRALAVIATWGALWIAPVLLLAALFGPNSVFMPIAGFFSQMAVVTFGGAYAVLAYVAQEAVTGFGWLKPGEMLDGLALAETTPGPLILVLTYVGFLAAYRAPGMLDPLVAAFVGAALTTWVTFIPCFLWIFLGAPHVERLRGNKALSGALAAITAAVVGVILNLAMWFGLNFIFRQMGTLKLGPIDMPWPVWSSLDGLAAVLAIGAAIAMFRFKLGMITVLGIFAVAGLILKLGVTGLGL
jgi:chromate transporter